MVVGARGFEPLTPSASRKCSPPELSARSLRRCAAKAILAGFPQIARAPLEAPRTERFRRLRPCRPAARLPPARGSGSVGRAQPCQGWGRGFESRLPLHRSFADRYGHMIGPAGLAVETGPCGPHGDVAKWQGRGLQSPHPRFESGRRLQDAREPRCSAAGLSSCRAGAVRVTPASAGTARARPRAGRAPCRPRSSPRHPTSRAGCRTPGPPGPPQRPPQPGW